MSRRDAAWAEYNRRNRAAKLGLLGLPGVTPLAAVVKVSGHNGELAFRSLPLFGASGGVGLPFGPSGVPARDVAYHIWRTRSRGTDVVAAADSRCMQISTGRFERTRGAFVRWGGVPMMWIKQLRLVRARAAQPYR
jgi:hypothetical protein